MQMIIPWVIMVTTCLIFPPFAYSLRGWETELLPGITKGFLEDNLLIQAIS